MRAIIPPKQTLMGFYRQRTGGHQRVISNFRRAGVFCFHMALLTLKWLSTISVATRVPYFPMATFRTFKVISLRVPMVQSQMVVFSEITQTIYLKLTHLGLSTPHCLDSTTQQPQHQVSEQKIVLLLQEHAKIPSDRYGWMLIQ